MTDHRTPEEIERDIERDRARLSNNLDTLSDKLSLDGIFNDITEQVRYHSGDIGRSLARTAKENPAALALTGIGLAWLMFGPKRDADAARYDQYRNPRYWGRGSDPEAQRLSRPDPSFKAGDDTMPSWARSDEDDYDYNYADRDDQDGPGFRDRIGAAGSSVAGGAKGAGRAVGSAAMGAGGMVRDGASAVGHGASNAASAVGHGASSAAGAVGSGLSSAGHAVGGAARTVGGKLRNGTHAVGSGLRSGAGTVAERAAALRERLSEGTEHMSEAARERVIAARTKAWEAQRAMRDRAARGGQAASDFYEAQPLVTGAIAMAVGAAIAGALPRTRIEDEKLGAYRDELMSEAERIYAEERERAKEAIDAATKEAKAIASDLKSEVDAEVKAKTAEVKESADAALARAKEASQRVADAARDKARENDLGKEAKKAVEVKSAEAKTSPSSTTTTPKTI